MSAKRRWLALGVGLTACAAVAAIVTLVLTGGGEPVVAPPADDPVALATSLSPERGLFGDRFLAEVELTIDTGRVDPATAKVAAFFRPFRRIGAIRVERTDLGRTTVLRYSYLIQCVDRSCAGEGGDRTFTLPQGLVQYVSREGGSESLELSFPAVSVGSRLSPEALRDIRAQPSALQPRAGSALPPISYSGSPAVLGWLLVGAGALIVLALGALLASRVRATSAAAVTAEAGALEASALGEALTLVEQALDGDDEDRRAALDELALELDRAGLPDLSRDARRLAWSRSGPEPGVTATLVVAARRSVDEAA